MSDGTTAASAFRLSRIRQLIPVTVLAITAAVYLPTLQLGFVNDDTPQIVVSQPHLVWRNLPSYFTSDVWSYISSYRTNYYRPVFRVWLMLNSEAFGAEPELWHLSAVLTHLAATLLFYFLARRLLGDPPAAGAAALLFGIHPAHVEAVAWISGASESLFAIFAFATILCYLRAGDETVPSRRSLYALAALTFFATALLTKETALILPILLAVYAWLFPRADARRPAARLRNAFQVTFPYLVVILFYVPLRIHVLKSFAPLQRAWSLSMVVSTWPLALGYYLRQLMLPIEYSIFYPVLPAKQLSAMNFYVPLAAVAAAAALAIWLCLRSRTFAFAAALLLVPVLPVLNLRVFAFDDFVHDRYLYLPVGGLALMLALGWQRLRERPRLQVASLVVVAALMASVTVWNTRFWKDDLTVYSHALAVAPNSTIVQIYYGEELIAEKKYLEALPVLQSALAGYLQGYDLYNDIAQCYAELGQYDKALDYLRDAIAILPGNSHFYINLAAIEMRMGRLTDAEAHARQALRVRPRISPIYDRYHACLAAVLEAKGDLPGALAEYETELAENPGYDDIRDRVRTLSTQLHRPTVERPTL